MLPQLQWANHRLLREVRELAQCPTAVRGLGFELRSAGSQSPRSSHYTRLLGRRRTWLLSMGTAQSIRAARQLLLPAVCEASKISVPILQKRKLSLLMQGSLEPASDVPDCLSLRGALRLRARDGDKASKVHPHIGRDLGSCVPSLTSNCRWHSQQHTVFCASRPRGRRADVTSPSPRETDHLLTYSSHLQVLDSTSICKHLLCTCYGRRTESHLIWGSQDIL